MYKIIVSTIFISLFSIANVFAQNFTVKEIYGTGEKLEAIVEDKGSGNEWIVQVGDKINEWLVVRIDEDKVVITNNSNEFIVSTELFFKPIKQQVMKPKRK